MMPLIAPPRFLIDEIVLVDVLALFLSIATVSILWYGFKKIFLKDIRSFLTFIIVIVPLNAPRWRARSSPACMPHSGMPRIIPP